MCALGVGKVPAIFAEKESLTPLTFGESAQFLSSSRPLSDRLEISFWWAVRPCFQRIERRSRSIQRTLTAQHLQRLRFVAVVCRATQARQRSDWSSAPALAELGRLARAAHETLKRFKSLLCAADDVAGGSQLDTCCLRRRSGSVYMGEFDT